MFDELSVYNPPDWTKNLEKEMYCMKIEYLLVYCPSIKMKRQDLFEDLLQENHLKLIQQFRFLYMEQEFQYVVPVPAQPEPEFFA